MDLDLKINLRQPLFLFSVYELLNKKTKLPSFDVKNVP